MKVEALSEPELRKLSLEKNKLGIATDRARRAQAVLYSRRHGWGFDNYSFADDDDELSSYVDRDISRLALAPEIKKWLRESGCDTVEDTITALNTDKLEGHRDWVAKVIEAVEKYATTST